MSASLSLSALPTQPMPVHLGSQSDRPERKACQPPALKCPQERMVAIRIVKRQHDRQFTCTYFAMSSTATGEELMRRFLAIHNVDRSCYQKRFHFLLDFLAMRRRTMMMVSVSLVSYASIYTPKS